MEAKAGFEPSVPYSVCIKGFDITKYLKC